jgi:hypothetical protein
MQNNLCSSSQGELCRLISTAIINDKVLNTIDALDCFRKSCNYMLDIFFFVECGHIDYKFDQIVLDFSILTWRLK